MQLFIATCLFIVGMIHILPICGVCGPRWLSALYGIDVPGPDLLILMQHRAILFGVLGALLMWSAFTPSLRTLALLSGIISLGSFVALACSVGSYNQHIGRVVVTDVLALALLSAAAVVHLLARKT